MVSSVVIWLLSRCTLLLRWIVLLLALEIGDVMTWIPFGWMCGSLAHAMILQHALKVLRLMAGRAVSIDVCEISRIQAMQL